MAELHAGGSFRPDGYVEEIKRGVHLMEAELERRGVDVEALMEERSPGEYIPLARRSTGEIDL